MKDFKNKVVIVTGASSGIGEAMAKVYAAQGAKVVLGARNVQKLQLLALKSALESNSKAPIRQPPLKLWFLLT